VSQHWQQSGDVRIRSAEEVPCQLMPDGLRFLLEYGLKKRGKEAAKIVKKIIYMGKEIFGLFSFC
jgi:hypothetical protein